VSDPIRDRCLDALRRNALLSDVLEEGYLPSRDDCLRHRVRKAMAAAVRRKRLRRSFLGAVSAAAALVALAIAFREPAAVQPPAPPPIPVSAPLEAFLVVTTATLAPVFEVLPSPSSPGFEVVRTAQLIGPLDRARDEDLLAAGGVAGIVGHPGGVRRLILTSPAPHRSQE